MKLTRRRFCSAVAATPLISSRFSAGAEAELSRDVVIIGGGLGGCVAAIAALRNGLRVVMTEQSDWIGGQLTSQGVPPDEHRWIETTGANQSYRELRSRIRQHYRKHYPLTDAARKNAALNPGNGNVSRLCSEPRVSLAVLEAWLEPFEKSGQLVVLREHVPISADVDADRVLAVTVRSAKSGESRVLTGPYFVDATELGDLLPLTGTEFVTGSEARSETRELHAGDKADGKNQQAFTMCFAVDHLADENHTIDRPDEYAFWRDFVPKMTPPWPGRLLDFTYTHPPTGRPKRLAFDPDGGRTVGGVLNLWTYRRIIDDTLFEPGRFDSDVSLINWPQNDYLLGNLIGVSDDEAARHVARAKQVSLSLLYWLQTEAPRRDGGTGFPGLRLRADLMGTDDGLAKMPYIRESRRIKAEFTVLEEHVGRQNRSMVTGQPVPKVRAQLSMTRSESAATRSTCIRALAGTTTSTLHLCHFRYRLGHCYRFGCRTCYLPARTSERRISPAVATACIRLSGELVKPSAALSALPCRRSRRRTRFERLLNFLRSCKTQSEDRASKRNGECDVARRQYVHGGAVSNELIELTDLLATCAALLDTELPAGAGPGSRNAPPALPVLLSDKPGKRVRDYAVHHSLWGAFAIRSGPWKLTAHRGSGGFTYPRDIDVEKTGGPPGQLYNLVEDPSETENVWDQNPNVVSRLSSLLAQVQSQD